VRAVEGGAGVAGALERARELAAVGIERDQRAPVAAQTRWPSWVTPWMWSAPSKGPYSRTISAARAGAGFVAWLSCLGVGHGWLLARAMQRRRRTNLSERQRGGE
jgi:hypothetical protein